jgi:hypothetical protein
LLYLVNVNWSHLVADPSPLLSNRSISASTLSLLFLSSNSHFNSRHEEDSRFNSRNLHFVVCCDFHISSLVCYLTLRDVCSQCSLTLTLILSLTECIF